MPELPEVEAARRMVHDALVGRRLAEVDVRDDEIVFEGVAPEVLRTRLSGARVSGTGRRGKFFWLDLDGGPTLLLHLGMSGGIVETTPGRTASVNYYRINHDADAESGPRFLKLALTTDEGRSVAFADGRRLGRIWTAPSASECPRVARLGPDALLEMPTPSELRERTIRRRTPIKALLLDQAYLAGIGNYLADEILYAAGIAPARPASGLDEAETDRLHQAIVDIVGLAVAVDADYERFPPGWLFHVRWGGAKGHDATADGEPIVRETIGGRTTAWVPTRQR